MKTSDCTRKTRFECIHCYKLKTTYANTFPQAEGTTRESPESRMRLAHHGLTAFVVKRAAGIHLTALQNEDCWHEMVLDLHTECTSLTSTLLQYRFNKCLSKTAMEITGCQ